MLSGSGKDVILVVLLIHLSLLFLLLVPKVSKEELDSLILMEQLQL